ncbi:MULTISPECIES: patatin-like phospholipase family protein [Thermaerobacter]|uniref:Patatin-like phospholipase family protein n=1 Tax=Thermaerobacter composti TaxID=554949 RepID=A0ABZ0QKQ5_9FIRM|nr:MULTISPECIES: patatin-like phospholipase family protein [Thermaerobacter]PZN08379.1 MAG: patatin [Bacillota bacterium]QBS38060.1 patatin [Thermaerobacter sp. FW80]WPD18076.1 patatin-like phospholipase family protein [Thermaerobacter composti]
MNADAVLSGGGVRVIALVGALEVAEERGYRWVNLGGTSAGAIVAALRAAGYTPAEMRQLMETVDFRRFRDRDALDRIPLAGGLLSLLLENGIYEGKALEAWLEDLLARKGVRVFRDLELPPALAGEDPRFRYRLQVVAADVTRRRMVVLPRDLPAYGLEPGDFPVARAVRMSAALPYFYEPVPLVYPTPTGPATSLLVDGGLVANFPVWLFDVEGVPPWPTFGFRLADPVDQAVPFDGPLGYLVALISTALEAREELANAHTAARTIAVPTLGVRTTDFELDLTTRRRLYEAGREAATRFFRRWDFGRYKQAFRGQAGPLAV